MNINKLIQKIKNYYFKDNQNDIVHSDEGYNESKTREINYNKESTSEKMAIHEWKKLVFESNLSVRTTNILLNNFSSPSELVSCNRDKLFKLKNCGAKTVKEILYFIEYLKETGLIESLKDIPPQNEDISANNNIYSRSLKDILSLPPHNDTINFLPVFNSRTDENISISDLHPDFRPYIPLSDISFSTRTKSILDKMGLQTIGKAMCTPQKLFLRQKNFGRKSLDEIHQTIKQILFENLLGDSFDTNISKDTNTTIDLLADSVSYSKNNEINQACIIDYSSYETMVDNFIKSTIQTNRNQKFIFDRFCFQSPKIPTLEELGKKHGVTRERARQIILKAVTILKIKSNLKRLTHFWDMVEKLIRIGGGVIHLDALATTLKEEFKWPHKPNSLAMGQLLTLWLPNHKVKETSSVIEIDCECLSCEWPLKAIQSLDFESSESFHLEVVKGKLLNNCQRHCVNKSVPVLTFHNAFLERVISFSGAKFIIQEELLYPYEKWVIKKGESLEELIKDVLKRHERPMHFKEIACQVRKISSLFESMDDRNFHASLSRYQSVELVERGTFALKEWAMERYRSVSDAIDELLQRAYFPLRRKDIITQLKDDFSEGNISTALAERTNRFIAIGEGFYDCRERWQQRTLKDLMQGLPKSLLEFVTYLVTNNNCSYKPVLSLMFITGMGEDGTMHLSKLKMRFYNFYAARHFKGLIVEKADSLASKINIFDTLEFKKQILKYPILSFLNSGFFKEIGVSIKLKNDIVSYLNIEQYKDIVIVVLIKIIDEYFLSIGSPSETKYPIKMQGSKLFDTISDTLPTVLGQNNKYFNNSGTEISIKKAKRVKIKL